MVSASTGFFVSALRTPKLSTHTVFPPRMTAIESPGTPAFSIRAGISFASPASVAGFMGTGAVECWATHTAPHSRNNVANQREHVMRRSWVVTKICDEGSLLRRAAVRLVRIRRVSDQDFALPYRLRWWNLLSCTRTSHGCVLDDSRFALFSSNSSMSIRVPLRRQSRQSARNPLGIAVGGGWEYSCVVFLPSRVDACP